MGTKTKIMEWSITIGKDSKGHYYEMTHGQKGGKMQTARTYIKSGKNIGRKNETTAEQQCLLEATSKHTYQIERKGYSIEEPSSVPFRPMLAKVYANEKDKVIFPCVIQVKIDGCVSGDTFIKTKEFGYKTIQYIVDNKINCKVLSYNEKTKRAEYKNIINHFKKKHTTDQWYEIETDDGIKLKVTGNHKIYLPELKCWRRVDELTDNQNLMEI